MHRIFEKQIVPVVALDRADDAVPLAEALLKGGLDILEIVLRTEAAARSLQEVHRAHPELLLGAGTILSAAQVDQALECGAQFGVAPGLNEEVVRHAQRRGLPFVPGVTTPTEVERALALGCRLLKFFPAEAAGGAKALAAYAGPFAHTGVRFIPLGGVHAGNMAAYLGLPIVAAVGGSWLVDRALIAARDWARITQRTREAVARAAASRPNPTASPGTLPV